jgi:hypothetical protein
LLDRSGRRDASLGTVAVHAPGPALRFSGAVAALLRARRQVERRSFRTPKVCETSKRRPVGRSSRRRNVRLKRKPRPVRRSSRRQTVRLKPKPDPDLRRVDRPDGPSFEARMALSVLLTHDASAFVWRPDGCLCRAQPTSSGRPTHRRHPRRPHPRHDPRVHRRRYPRAGPTRDPLAVRCVDGRLDAERVRTSARLRSRRPPDHPTVEGSRWAEPAAELEPSTGPTRRRPGVAQGFGRVSEPRSNPCRVRPVDDAARVDGPGLGRTSCWGHPPGLTGSIPPDASGPALRRASGLGILHCAPTTTARRLFVYTRIRPGARIRVSPA